jgi:hypothetical protein
VGRGQRKRSSANYFGRREWHAYKSRQCIIMAAVELCCFYAQVTARHSSVIPRMIQDEQLNCCSEYAACPGSRALRAALTNIRGGSRTEHAWPKFASTPIQPQSDQSCVRRSFLVGRISCDWRGASQLNSRKLTPAVSSHLRLPPFWPPAAGGVGSMSSAGRDVRQQEIEQILQRLREGERLRAEPPDGPSHDQFVSRTRFNDRLTSHAIVVSISVAAAVGLATTVFWPFGTSPSVSAPQPEASASAKSLSAEPVISPKQPDTEPPRRIAGSELIQPKPWPPSHGLTAAIPITRDANSSALPPWPTPDKPGAVTALTTEAPAKLKADETRKAAATAASQRKLKPEQSVALAKRADALLRVRDISGARLILRLLADNGDARAAYLLGNTFDPDYLKENRIIGIQPDQSQARGWYELARNLGYSQAAQTLQAMSVQTVGGR